MCKKLIYLLALVFAVGAAGNASAELVAQWKLDEGAGTTAMDASGNGNNGTLQGGPTVVEENLDKRSHLQTVASQSPPLVR